MQLLQQRLNDSTNWSLFDQLFGLRNELARFIESPSGDSNRTSEFFNGWVPAMDIWEDKNNLVIKAEVPGMKKDEIEITLHDGILSIAGERKIGEKAADAEVYRSERCYGRFHRTISLPVPVQADQVAAGYKDGILTVTLPKTEEAKPRQIAVNAA